MTCSPGSTDGAKPAPRRARGRATQVHHLLRRSQGGTDEPENLLRSVRPVPRADSPPPGVGLRRGSLVSERERMIAAFVHERRGSASSATPDLPPEPVLVAHAEQAEERQVLRDIAHAYDIVALVDALTARRRAPRPRQLGARRPGADVPPAGAARRGDRRLWGRSPRLRDHAVREWREHRGRERARRRRPASGSSSIPRPTTSPVRWTARPRRRPGAQWTEDGAGRRARILWPAVPAGRTGPSADDCRPRTVLEQVRRRRARMQRRAALVALHQAEYDELVMDELAKRGVFPNRTNERNQ